MRVTIRYFAAARAAAQTHSGVIDLPDDATLGDLERILAADHPELARVLPRCSYLRDEIAMTDRNRELGPTQTVDVLPPFAGG